MKLLLDSVILIDHFNGVSAATKLFLGQLPPIEQIKDLRINEHQGENGALSKTVLSAGAYHPCRA